VGRIPEWADSIPDSNGGISVCRGTILDLSQGFPARSLSFWRAGIVLELGPGHGAVLSEGQEGRPGRSLSGGKYLVVEEWSELGKCGFWAYFGQTEDGIEEGSGSYSSS
jgi:hypothetical protein